MARESQGELFTDLEHKHPQYNSAAKQLFMRKVPHVLQLSMDVAASAVIVVILAVIVSFVLGYETGRKRATAAFEGREETNAPAPAGGKGEKVVVKEITIGRAKPAPGAGTAMAVKPAEKSLPAKPYTIQAGVFRQRKDALDKAAELKKIGLEAMAIEYKGVYKVCVGSYAGPKEAENDLIRCRIAAGACFVTTRN